MNPVISVSEFTPVTLPDNTNFMVDLADSWSDAVIPKPRVARKVLVGRVSDDQLKILICQLQEIIIHKFYKFCKQRQQNDWDNLHVLFWLEVEICFNPNVGSNINDRQCHKCHYCFWLKVLNFNDKFASWAGFNYSS